MLGLLVVVVSGVLCFCGMQLFRHSSLFARRWCGWRWDTIWNFQRPIEYRNTSRRMCILTRQISGQTPPPPPRTERPTVVSALCFAVCLVYVLYVACQEWLRVLWMRFCKHIGKTARRCMTIIICSWPKEMGFGQHFNRSLWLGGGGWPTQDNDYCLGFRLGMPHDRSRRGKCHKGGGYAGVNVFQIAHVKESANIQISPLIRFAYNVKLMTNFTSALFWVSSILCPGESSADSMHGNSEPDIILLLCRKWLN